MANFKVEEALSAQMFDRACELINDGVARGENPLVCLHAVESILRKQEGHIEERFIDVLMNDLSDMYFWQPECSYLIEEKWHTQGIDLYKPYTNLISKGEKVCEFQEATSS